MSRKANRAEREQLNVAYEAIEQITRETWAQSKASVAPQHEAYASILRTRMEDIYDELIAEPRGYLLSRFRGVAADDSTTSYVAVASRLGLEAFHRAVHSDLQLDPNALKNIHQQWEPIYIAIVSRLQALITEARAKVYLASIESFALNSASLLEEITAAKDEAAAATRGTLETLEAANQVLSRKALLREAEAFREAHDTFKRQAWAWLLALLVSTLTLAGTLACWIRAKPAVPEPTLSWHTAANLGYFGPRVALVSLLTTIVVISVQHFRSASHNRVINLHRASSIVTVEALIKRGQGPTADMLLQFVAQSVFAPAATGYSSKDPVVPPHVIGFPGAPAGGKD